MSSTGSPAAARRNALLAALAACITLAIASCGGSSSSPAGSAAGAAAPAGGASSPAGGASSPAGGASAPALGAAVSVPVEVSVASMKTAPFDVPRALTVPQGFGIRIWARVAGARFMAVTPSGDVLVSLPGAGKIVRVSPRSGQAPAVSDLVGGLNLPHDMVFATIGAQTYLYVGEQNQIVRFAYDTAANSVGAKQVLVANLPYGSNSELGSQYGHPLKNLAIRGGKMYVAVASQSNADARERDPSQVAMLRAAVYEYNLDGSGGRLYAKGLRNAEGLAISPEGDLWVVVNNRDQTPYPYTDGKYAYGAVVQEFVNDYPPEPFAKVTDGSDHGWPLCNPNPFTASGRKNMPFDRDYDNNRDGSKLDCGKLTPMAAGFEPHGAPLGVSFWTNGPGGYKNAAVAGLHGCWNCNQPRGYKVAMYSWKDAAAGGGPDREYDLVTGFYSDPSNLDPNNKFSSWGRPVDAVPYPDGSLLISDDKSGTIYQLYAKP
jgi:glucose/arabinose dehydrogenase